MITFNRYLINVCSLIFFMILILSGMAYSQHTKHHRGLDKILNPDGSVKPGVTGSFKTEGYELEFDKTGKPILRKSSPNEVTSIATWNSLGSGRTGISNLDGSTGSVYAMAINSEGDVYVGGNIGFVGDLFINNIAKWDVREQKWETLPCGTTNGVEGFVETIAINGTDVYVGGGFATSLIASQASFLQDTLSGLLMQQQTLL
ncbi:MAG: hypothetical protein R6W90_03505 [Ignavibacteriaceae bacterium]